MTFAPVTTLEDLDSLDNDEFIAGYHEARRGDPEPGANHTRAYWHGWRCRMMDYREMECPPEHAELIRQYVARGKFP